MRHATMSIARVFCTVSCASSMIPSLAFAAFFALVSPAQNEQTEATPDPQLVRVWERWDQFEADEHASMGASIEGFVFAADHPKLRVMASLREPENALKSLEKADLPRFSAKEYAPKLKLRDKTIQRDSSEWERFVSRVGIDPRARPDAFWRWSSGRQALVPAQREALKPRARIEHLLAGKLPDLDWWIARLEAELDHDKNLHEIAQYFEHCYRDRNGKFYEGLRLADMWATQQRFGISDVEAIAFLREVLEDDSIKSPIPDRLHNGIYALIRDQYAELRESQQLRRALAASFFHAYDEVPLILKAVAPRLDLAWALVGDDPARMAAWLREHPSRKGFLGSVEKRIAERLRQDGVSEDELRTRPTPWAAHLPVRAREGLRREGLMGIRGR